MIAGALAGRAVLAGVGQPRGVLRREVVERPEGRLPRRRRVRRVDALEHERLVALLRETRATRCWAQGWTSKQ
jgi:hypothetical protein